MAIAIDATSQGETASGASLTIAHTCTGTNRVLYLAVYTFNSPTPSTVTATYAGTGMTALGNTVLGSENKERLTVLRLIAPATGANNIVITPSINPSEIAMAAVSWTGVDQTTPFDTASLTAPDAGTAVSQTIST